jgi:type I restriction enzyme M protein
VNTFRERRSEGKYSYAATLDEIRKNDYNLNIPRYVDTFEEEEAVDLADVSRRFKGLDEEITAADSLIVGFCKELGIDTPF